MIKQVFAAGLLLWSCLGIGCSSRDAPSRVHAESNATQPSRSPTQASASPELAAIPEIDLNRLEAPSGAQVRAAQAALAAAPADRRGDAYGQLGMLYHAYELRAASAACYENAALLQPEEFRWHYLRGHVLKLSGQADAAADCFERAVALLEAEPAETSSPLLIAAACWLGSIHLDAGRLEEAQSNFASACQQEPGNAYAHYGLGRVAALRGDNANALDHLEVALKLMPEAGNIQHLLGTLHRRLGNAEEAERLLLQSSGVHAKVGIADPLVTQVMDLAESSHKYQNLGDRYYGAHRYDEAIAAYRKAIDINAANPRLYCNLGSALNQSGDLAGAEAAFRESIRLDPEFVTAQFNLGVLCGRTLRDPEAVAHYRAAIEVDPNHKDALFNLANTQYRGGEYEEAELLYVRVLQLDEAHGPANVGLARVLALLGQHGEAIECLRHAAAILPERLDIRHDLARLLVSAPEEPLRDGAKGLKLALSVFQQQSFVMHAETVAMAYAEVGDFEQALAMQDAAIDAATREGRPDLARQMEANRALFQQGRPSRVTWHEE